MRLYKTLRTVSKAIHVFFFSLDWKKHVAENHDFEYQKLSQKAWKICDAKNFVTCSFTENGSWIHSTEFKLWPTFTGKEKSIKTLTESSQKV